MKVTDRRLMLGIALLTKLTWIILFGLWPLLWCVWSILETPKPASGVRKIQLSQLGLILLLAIYVLNAGYGFRMAVDARGAAIVRVL